mmetsp:Transcript_47595/g.101616  ORF Transcript_47595/g.101616 Transcript_47595/m.101616 type:complete len:98 (+) Transcript_47595:8-301(+)
MAALVGALRLCVALLFSDVACCLLLPSHGVPQFPVNFPAVQTSRLAPVDMLAKKGGGKKGKKGKKAAAAKEEDDDEDKDASIAELLAAMNQGSDDED